MRPVVDASAIRLRVLEVLAASHFMSIAAAAGRLHVDESDLRGCLDPDHPVPSTNVLCAIVEYAGVDPMWLVTGHYDIGSHRGALGDDPPTTRLAISRLLSGRVTPPSVRAVRDDAAE